MDIKEMLQNKTEGVYHISPDATVPACAEMLTQRKVGALVVLAASGSLEGIISERDIVHAAAEKPNEFQRLKVKDVMTPKGELITATLQDVLASLMQRMTNEHIRHIPILDGGKVIGIVSIGDVVKRLLNAAEEENAHMKDYIYGRYSG